MQTPALHLKNFTFAELFHAEGLLRLDQCFLDFLQQKNASLHQQLLLHRQHTDTISPIALSELLIACAIVLEEFLIELFAIEKEAAATSAATLSHNPIATFKKNIILKKAKKQLMQSADYPSFNELNQWLNEKLKKASLKSDDRELATALLANEWLQNSETHAEELERLTQWCVQAIQTPEGKKFTQHWSAFHLPERLDYANLIPLTTVEHDKLHRLSCDEKEFRYRDGFKLTDPRMNAREVQDEVNYCIYCHDHEGDFCSKGFPVKKGDPSQGLKNNPLDVTLTGCPLEERISEMNFLKHQGYTLASLAMIMIDNPMCPATGHRICNDCMKACIYQKQDPVNIPQIETRVLTDVLALPWGVEIYDLLTRWNPLRPTQWQMKPYNGLKVLIAGMGPAGFTLAHHLLLEGFAVVGFDGLKIEPLPEHFISQPIHRFEHIKEELDERIMSGFGGVAEYGITVRWDKNFLKLIYISLMRKPYFQVFGSTRFGGTLTVDDAWDMGFDHFVIAVGAGLPKALPIPGSLAPGMRQANDFLMALQLGNAAKPMSLTNIQVRLPAVVIGGGLTGVDTATEVQAYYIRQVEKILSRYETLIQHYGEDHILRELDLASQEILEEYLAHGKAVRKEREQAALQQRSPNFIKLIRQWGGVTIVYRRQLQESPAYINNHEELKKALEEGIFYLEALEPHEVIRNQFDHAETLLCHRRIKNAANEWETTTEAVHIPARAIFVATGTQPNIAYEFEHRGTFQRQGVQYQHYEDVNGELVIPHGAHHCKIADFGPFTSYRKHHFRISLIGDTHPVFHGNVVKAIASGLRTYPKILSLLQPQLGKNGDIHEYKNFAEKMTQLFQSTVTAMKRHADNVLELTISAPLAAKHFVAGQFYRLQNYETYARKFDHTSLQIEPLALTAFQADPQKGWLKFLIMEVGASSKLCQTFAIGEPVSLMGPTGLRAKVSHEKETVLIVGDHTSIPMVLSYGRALRSAGNKIIYLAHFRNAEDIYCRDELEKNTDVIIWNIGTTGSDPCFPNVIEALRQYNQTATTPLEDIDRIYIIGNTDLLRQFQSARKNLEKEFFPKQPRMFASVYSTMQCMLKGVCAQCLQWQIDPETGLRTKAVFACSWPEQPLELIDINNIDERHIQNRLQEKLTDLWVDHVLGIPSPVSEKSNTI